MHHCRLVFIVLHLFLVNNVFAQNINTPENFPDQKFRTVVEEFMNVAPGGEFSAQEAAAKTGVLNCDYKWIMDISGIEFFTGITELNCFSNHLTHLDVSKNTSLLSLCCYNNKITDLDLRFNTNLQKLDCAVNRLTSLDLSNNPLLQYLDCGGNPLSNLNVNVNNGLTSLYCYSNGLQELDISKNTNLKLLSCQGNRLKELDVSLNASLLTLNCYSNFIDDIDLSNNPNLSVLDCHSNLISLLDVSQNQVLSNMNCSDNRLSMLDISLNPTLKILNFSNNQLLSVDVSFNKSLTELYCDSNEINNLSLTGNTALRKLYCCNNQLSDLDISGNGNLQWIVINNNQLTTLNLSNLTKMKVLECSNTRLQNLDVSAMKSLVYLDCSGNQLTQLDLSSNKILDWICCNNNQIANLILPVNRNLSYLECSNNQILEINVTSYPNLFMLNCSNNHIDHLNGIVSNTGFRSFCAVDVRYNDLDEDDWEQVLQFSAKIGEPRLFFEHHALESGFSYSPQNGYDPYYFGTGEPLVDDPETQLGTERRINLEGTSNTRDLGGIKTVDGRRIKRGILFRSDALDLSNSDLPIFSGMNICFVCDLRTSYQYLETPDRYPLEKKPIVLSIPMIEETISNITPEKKSIQRNEKYAFNYTDFYSELFQDLLKPEYHPALIHCQAGKDRAGFTTALILSTLGVPREIIEKDYALTLYYLKDVYLGAAKDNLSSGIPSSYITPSFKVDMRKIIRTTFETIDETYGSFENYLQEGLGVTPEMRQRLQDQFLETGDTDVSGWRLR